MTTAHKSRFSFLEKINEASNKKKGDSQGKGIDFSELKELKKLNFIKLKKGKNHLAVIPFDQEDPFVLWGYHKELQEKTFYTVPCDAFNKNKDCLACSVIDDLKKENLQGNKNLWYPIRRQIEFYVPVVNLESEETINEGAKWMRFTSTVMSQFKEWLDNTDDDEEPFYSLTSPQKIILTFTFEEGETLAKDMYKVDKKNMKPFDPKRIAEWHAKLRPVKDFLISKSESQMKKIVDDYFARIADDVKTPQADDKKKEVAVEAVDEAPSKLDFLKISKKKANKSAAINDDLPF